MGKASSELSRNRAPAQPKRPDDALLAAWEKTLRDNRDRSAILDRKGNVARTFGEIEERAAEFADELEAFRPGEVIAVQIGNHPDWASLFLACLRRRLVVLPLEQTISDAQRNAAFHTCRVVLAAVRRGSSVVFRRVLPVRTPASTTPTSSRAKPRDPAEVILKLSQPHASAAPRSASDDSHIGWQNRQPSLLKLTSGTTAAPRAVRFRSEQLLADCENICETMGITAGDLNFGVIPISHSYGFSNLLTPLLARGVALVLSNDRMPHAILDGISATGATVFPGMPVFYQSFCELQGIAPLRALRLCISAGAPLTPAVAENFRSRFGSAIHSFYGSSECGGICYARKPQPVAGFVGEPMRGVQVEPLERENASVVRVRSEAVGDGYFPEEDIARLGKGVFLPDDLLEKIPGGYRIVGRVSDLINVAGKKVNPAEVEAAILQCRAVREAVVFARKSERRHEEVAACIVADADMRETELLAHCRSRLSSWQTPRRIFLVDRLPVNERGKISRRELAMRYGSAEDDRSAGG